MAQRLQAHAMGDHSGGKYFMDTNCPYCYPQAAPTRAGQRWEITILLKAGQPFSFCCDELNVEVTPDQKLSRLDWLNATPGIRYLHFDNIAVILQRDLFDGRDGSTSTIFGTADVGDQSAGEDLRSGPSL